MNRKAPERVRREAPVDGGFTLVELMVVLMILAILLAIIVPSYLGARERSQDRATQVNLDHALTAAKVAYSDYGSYGPLAFDVSGPLTTEVITIRRNGTTSSLVFNRSAWHRARAIEPRIRWTAFGSSDSDRISFHARISADERRHDIINLAALSDTGVCWFIHDDDEDGTIYGFVDMDGLAERWHSTKCSARHIDFTALKQVFVFDWARGTQYNRDPQGPYVPYTDRYGNPAYRFVERPVCFWRDGWRPNYRPPSWQTPSYPQWFDDDAHARSFCPPDDPLPR